MVWLKLKKVSKVNQRQKTTLGTRVNERRCCKDTSTYTHTHTRIRLTHSQRGHVIPRTSAHWSDSIQFLKKNTENCHPKEDPNPNRIKRFSIVFNAIQSAGEIKWISMHRRTGEHFFSLGKHWFRFRVKQNMKNFFLKVNCRSSTFLIFIHSKAIYSEFKKKNVYFL